MKTLFTLTTGLLAGFVGTVTLIFVIADGNGKYKELIDALAPDY